MQIKNNTIVVDATPKEDNAAGKMERAFSDLNKISGTLKAQVSNAGVGAKRLKNALTALNKAMIELQGSIQDIDNS